MPNKHQARIREEALTRRGASQFEVAVDPKTDIVSVKDGGVQIVRRSMAAYDRLPPSGQSFLGHNYLLRHGGAVGTVTTIGTITVPEAMMLDISEIRFVITYAAAPFIQAVPDYAPTNLLYFRIHIDGINPWDQFTVEPTTPAQIEGWSILNQNILESWSDTPVHLAATPHQVVTLEMDERAAFFNIFGVNVDVQAHIRGRWIPYQLWRDIILDNRGGGEEHV